MGKNIILSILYEISDGIPGFYRCVCSTNFLENKDTLCDVFICRGTQILVVRLQGQLVQNWIHRVQMRVKGMTDTRSGGGETKGML